MFPTSLPPQCVSGELYEVDDAMLAFLDDFESHPGFYCRELAQIALTSDPSGQEVADGSTQEAWVYFLPKFKSEMKEKMFLESYSSNSKHHLPYVERYKRKGLVKDMVLPQEWQSS